MKKEDKKRIKLKVQQRSRDLRQDRTHSPCHGPTLHSLDMITRAELKVTSHQISYQVTSYLKVLRNLENILKKYCTN